MTDKIRAAKAALSKQEHLIGFMKCRGGHKVQRASSAKVTAVEPSPRKDSTEMGLVGNCGSYGQLAD
jgi:hypothetical protein